MTSSTSSSALTLFLLLFFSPIPSWYGWYEHHAVDEPASFTCCPHTGWSGSGGLGAKEQGIQDPIKGGDIRDKWDQYKGVGVSLDDPYENYRRNKSYNFVARMKAREEGTVDVCGVVVVLARRVSIDCRVITVKMFFFQSIGTPRRPLPLSDVTRPPRGMNPKHFFPFSFLKERGHQTKMCFRNKESL